MIKYNLLCKCGKNFESWFSTSKEYDILKKIFDTDTISIQINFPPIRYRYDISYRNIGRYIGLYIVSAWPYDILKKFSDTDTQKIFPIRYDILKKFLRYDISENFFQYDSIFQKY